MGGTAAVLLFGQPFATKSSAVLPPPCPSCHPLTTRLISAPPMDRVMRCEMPVTPEKTASGPNSPRAFCRLVMYLGWWCGGWIGLGWGVRPDARTVAGAELTATMVLVLAAGLVVLVRSVAAIGRGWLVVKSTPPPPPTPTLHPHSTPRTTLACRSAAFELSRAVRPVLARRRSRACGRSTGA